MCSGVAQVLQDALVCLLVCLFQVGDLAGAENCIKKAAEALGKVGQSEENSCS